MITTHFYAQDAQGNILPGADVFVYLTGTTTLATGLQTALGAALANPFKASATGQIQFQAPNDNYDVRVKSGPRESTLRRVQIFDSILKFEDLANFTDPTKGAAWVGWQGRTQADHNAESVSLADLGILPGGSYTVAQVAAAINNSSAPSIQVPDGAYNLVASGVPALTITRAVRLWGGKGAVFTIPRGITFSNCSDGCAEGFTLNTTDAVYHFAVWARGSGGNHSFNNLRINSAYGFMGTGDASDAANPTDCVFALNKGTCILGSLNRVSGTSPTIDGGPLFIENKFDVVASPVGVSINKVGIESWIGGTRVIRNKITSLAKLGGFGGITFGLYPNQRAESNYVYGFSAGVEWGNTGGLLHILDNTLIGCGTGLYDGTNGEELAPNATGNMIVQGPWGVTPVRAVNIKSQNVDLSGCVAIYTEDGNFNDDITITGTPPAGLTAIYADTNNRTLTISGMRIFNYDIGLRAAATSGTNLLSLVKMYGVKYPISDSGGNPVNILSACEIRDFLTFRVNKTLDLTSSSLSRPTGGIFAAAIGKVPAQFLDTGSPNTQFIYHSNILDGVASDPFTTNANMPDGGGSGYLRPKLAIIDGGVHRVKNVADYATAAAEVSAVLGSVPYDLPIQTWSTNNTFIRRRHAMTTITSGSDTIEQYV